MNSRKETINGQMVSAKLFFAIIFTIVFLLAGQATCFATTVTLQWDPVTDTGLAGYKVYYQADSSVQPFSGTGATQGNSPVDIYNQTTATIGGLDPAHAYYFTVTAYYSSGVESVYSNIVYVPELVSPMVAISSPTNNATVSGTVSVTASASDNVGVTKVEFYVNGVLQGTDTSTPYLFSWNTSALAAGTYTLMAKAYDAAGNVGQASNVSVTVVKDTTPPTVAVTSPANNATVSGTVAITVSASDSVGVSSVEFYENGVLLSATNVAPYSYNWNTTTVANGSYALTARAYDAASNVAQSANVNITVSNFIDTSAPTVTAFTLPGTGSSLSIPVSLFTATDNVGVTGYCITTTNSSASCTWSGAVPSSVTFAGAGNQAAWAWAKDAAGNISAGASASTTITISNITLGETNLLSTDDYGNANLLLAQTSTLAQTATIQSMSFYVTTAAGNLSLGVYDATGPGGGPGTLIASTASITPTVGWNTANVTTPVLLNAGTYWLAYLPSNDGLHFRKVDTGSTTKLYSYTYGALPTTFSTSPSTSTSHFSLYATLATTSPDTTAPVLSAFTMPATASSLTVAVSSLTATDAVGVTGYLITGSATAPTAGAAGWTASAPTSFTFSGAGSKTAYAWAKDAAGNVSSSRSAAVTITLPDTTAPVLSAFTMPATATSLNVAVSSFTATDAVGVTGYLITESATAPTAGAAGWTASAPTSFTFSGAGSKTAYAWAKDAAGNVSSSRSAAVTITLPDTTAPVLSAFTMPATATSLNVAVSSFTATDAVGVTGYLITESATAPTAGAAGWTASAPTSFTFSGAGSKTAYAWAKDAAGNVSSSRSAAVTITLPDTTAPVLSAFTMPATATSLNVAVSSFTATDAVGVTGYLITESATAPTAGAAGWTASAPTSFTFSGAGSKTAYAWAKDAAGNVSSSRSAAVTITLSDTTAPVATIKVRKASAGVLSVTATATDNVGVSKVEFYVNGVLASTDTTSPYIFNWDTTAVANGSYSLTAKAYDSAGNIGKSGSVVIKIPYVQFR